MNNKIIQFGDIKISNSRPFLIAEAGVNHENSLQNAINLVKEAAKCGCDAIKFQSYKAETIASKFSPSYWDLSKEPTESQHELFKKYDSFDKNEYEILARTAIENNILFMSTPFDHRFADILCDLMPMYKIASADITNYPLLEHCAKKMKPMIISTGASTIGEVETAVRLIESTGNKNICIMHCVLSYPTNPKNANLNIIKHLKKIFPNYLIGYSDHVPPFHDCLALTTSWLLGARIIEKHFTLDKNMKGNDHYHAMDPTDVINFRNECEFIHNSLGQSVKEVLECEKQSRLQARRSLVINKNKNCGDVISKNDILIKRPGTGIEPQHLDLIVGKKLLCDIKQDELLEWKMFLS